MIRQLISAREYTKPVRFFAGVDARKRLKPTSTEDGYKPVCSVDRPSVSSPDPGSSMKEMGWHTFPEILAC